MEDISVKKENIEQKEVTQNVTILFDLVSRVLYAAKFAEKDG